MLVVHGVCAADGAVQLWAEDTRHPVATLTDLDNGVRPARHPFAAPRADLASLASNDAATGRLVVVLPSTRTGPVASPELAAALVDGAAPADPGAQVVLRPWQVETVRVEEPGALGPLREPGAAFRLGASARFVLAVGAFAADLVDRGRVLPALQRDDAEGCAARWWPVLAGPDAERFAELAGATPPAFCAAAEEHGVVAFDDAADALSDALDGFVDALVRVRLRAAGRVPSPPHSPRRSALGRASADWLRALGGEPRFPAAGAAARALDAKIGAWRSGGTRSWPTRLCLRLGEPGELSRTTSEGDPDAWRVDFLLQAVEEPGVRVPASEVWERGHAGPATWRGDDEEALLAGLGRAVTVWPELGRALREARPTGLDLTREQAQEFLTAAGALEQEGFGVLVPSWWTRPPRLAPRLTVRAASPVTPVLRDVAADRDQIVSFRWSISLGDLDVSAAEFDELTAAKSELVKFRGRWTRVDPATLAGLDLARLSAGGRMPVRDVLAHAGLLPGAGGDDAEVEVVADGWLGDLLSGASGALVRPPAGLGVRLRPYQLHGLSWLALLDRFGVGAVLADDMGLGKTIQVLALELLARSTATERRAPTLVVCPTTVLGNWLREAEQVTPSLTVLTHGTPRPLDVRTAGGAAGPDLVLTTYPRLVRDLDAFRGVAWDRLVLDEAQQVKNAATIQARAVRALTARHRVALTGTPVENRLGDLWSIMHVVNPGLLGPAGVFRARYAVPIERYGDPDATARLRRRIRPVVLRRVKTDPTVLRDLPSKIELRQLCTLTAEQASLYRAVVDDMMERLRDRHSTVARQGIVLAAMTRLKQVCNHPAHLLGDGSALAGRSGKLARLEELLDQVVAEGERALCFTQFARFGAMLAPYLSARLGVEVLFLHGGLRAAERDALVERFQSGRGPGVFLLSLKAGGTGVNLTAANHVIHIDRWWNPAVESQATDRAFRIGQERDVWVRTLMCMGTLEERIDRILVGKADLARTVVGGGESWLASLSADELRDLVALAPEAVDE